MREILFADPARTAYLLPTLERMVRDPSIAVRSCVAGALIPILNHDRDLAVRLFRQLCNTEDALLEAPLIDHFLHYAVPTHFGAIEELLRRMIASPLPEVQKAGARQTCLAALGIPDAAPLARECLAGTEHHRAAAAEIYEANVKNTAFRSVCYQGLRTLFSDPDPAVRAEAASCFRRFGEGELGDYTDLIQAFVSSPAFSEHHENLFHALVESVAILPEVTRTACERVLEMAGASLGDIRQRAAMSGHYLTKLVPRMYATAASESARSRCLDLFDRMMELGMYGIQDVLEKLDR